MHSGFSAPRPARSPALALRSGNVRKTTSTGSPPFGATAWRRTGGPYLFGARGMVDAMYAPVATRFLTYDVQLDEVSAAYCQTIMPCQNCRSGSQPPGRNPKRSTSWTSSFEAHATGLLRPRQNIAAVRPRRAAYRARGVGGSRLAHGLTHSFLETRRRRWPSTGRPNRDHGRHTPGSRNL